MVVVVVVVVVVVGTARQHQIGGFEVVELHVDDGDVLGAGHGLNLAAVDGEYQGMSSST